MQAASGHMSTRPHLLTPDPVCTAILAGYLSISCSFICSATWIYSTDSQDPVTNLMSHADQSCLGRTLGLESEDLGAILPQMVRQGMANIKKWKEIFALPQTTSGLN